MNSLLQLHDDVGHDTYYEVLTGEKRANQGLIKEQFDTLKDKKRWRKWDSKRELVLFRLPESATRFSKRRRKTIPRRCAPPCSKPLPCAVPRRSFPKQPGPRR